eukprot:GHVU01083067.1.p1 GENE.GHVU01083067.1~~GHVU01083067.1.p1  ORF type:complete len:282 (-),score=23.01 GHVU01083067.1:463-1308(-)
MACYLASILLFTCMLTGSLAGRAFPVNSENFVVDLFQTINPNLEWDPTNFLVDLSGRYANCKNVGKQGQVTVDRQTPEGVGIGGMVDYAPGLETYSDAVQKYIETALQDWVYSEPFLSQIKRAERFGCSVQPGCKGNIAVACLFSPEQGGGSNKPQGIIDDGKLAQAFTEEQYKLTETIIGNKWDRSHFLENLSGRETVCSLIGDEDYAFQKAQQEGEKRGMYISGLYGSAPNRGNTEQAMVTILRQWKTFKSSNIGCSVIPDCKPPGGQMTVVVSCLFSN